MEKEIFEQVESVRRAMQGRIDYEYGTGHLGGLNLSNRELLEVNRIKILAAGTSYHAGMVASYVLEALARLPANAELASELRYRNPIVERQSLYFAMSQSGETADTLYAMREIQRKGGRVLGICNVVGSTIPRESDGGVYIHSGPEIAVASTKAFTSQLVALYLFALIMGRMRDLSYEQGLRFVDALEASPDRSSRSSTTPRQFRSWRANTPEVRISSFWVVVLTTRWRLRRRSSSRKSATFTRRATAPRRSNTARSP